MEVEELRTIVTAQITDFQSKMASVNHTIDTVQAKARKTSQIVDNVTRIQDNGATRVLGKMESSMTKLASIALRLRRPFSAANIRGGLAEQKAAIEDQRTVLQALIKKRDEAETKYAAALELSKGKHNSAIESVKRQESALAGLQDRLRKLGTGGAEIGSIRKLEDDLLRVAKSTEPAQREIDKLMEKYRDAEKMLAGFKTYNPPDSGVVRAQEEQLAALERAMKPYSDQLMEADKKTEQLIAKINSLKKNPMHTPEGEKLSFQIEAAKQKLEQLRIKAKQTGDELQRAFNADSTGGYGAKVKEAQAGLEASERAAGGFLGKLSAGLALFSKIGLIIYGVQKVIGLVTGVYNRIRKKREEEMAKFQKDIKTAGNVILLVFKNVGAGVLAIGKRIGNGFSDAIGGALHRIGGAFRSLFNSLVTSPLIGQIQNLFSSLGDSIASAERQFSSFGSKMNALRQNALQLQGAFASMFLPLINVAMPIINQVLAAVTTLFSTIAMWIARLTGQDAVLVSVGGVTEADAAGMNEAAKATKKNKEEKEKLKQVLAGFDQLTILNFGKKDKKDDEDEGAGAGAGGGFSAGPVYKKIPVQPLKIDNWMKFGRDLAKKINEMIEKIDAKKIGQKIGKVLQDAFEFAYGFLHEFKHNRLGNKIADILNNAFGELDFRLVGATFAEGINTVFRMGLDFVRTFRWAEFGRKIADGLYFLFTTIEWHNIASFFKEGINSVIKGGLALFENRYAWAEVPKMIGQNLSAAITGINWTGLGDLAAKGFNSVTSGIINFLGSFKWFDIGVKISGGLNIAIAGVNWPNLGKSVASGFNSVLAFIHGAVSEFKWGDAARNLFTSINSFIANVNWKDLGTTIADLFLGVIEWIQTALDTFEWDTLSKNIKVCINAFLDRADWPAVGKKLKDSFGDAIEHFKNMLKDLPWNDIAEQVGGFLRALDWPRIMQSVTSVIGDIFWDLLKGAIGLNRTSADLALERGKEVADAWAKRYGVDTSPAPDIGALMQEGKSNTQADANSLRDKLKGVPMFAQGGVFEPGNPLLGVLGDNMREREIAAPESALKQTFKSALDEMGLRGDSENTEVVMPVQVFVDGELVEETVTRRQVRRARQLNKPVFGGA